MVHGMWLFIKNEFYQKNSSLPGLKYERQFNKSVTEERLSLFIGEIIVKYVIFTLIIF